MEPKHIDCDMCDGTGMRPIGRVNDPDPPRTWCTDCNGTGTIEVETEIATLEDRDT